MKTTRNFSIAQGSLLIVCILLIGCAKITSQKTKVAQVHDFKVIVEKEGNEIKLRCEEGCAWKELSYNNNSKQQAIDEFGMTDVTEKSTQKDANLADFLFTLAKTEKGVSLKGIEGTAWTELSFSLKDKGQAIDRMGMTE